MGATYGLENRFVGFFISDNKLLRSLILNNRDILKEIRLFRFHIGYMVKIIEPTRFLVCYCRCNQLQLLQLNSCKSFTYN